ncbi:MAG TPA: GNAT family N-acetyltransferase [Steroidobacteraceae bacterium]|jgi:GNAT superfamily N-acetyltransferase|nr:GNAT family N-acetyltransferase [Steroidobacteraceae bacterium]
MSIRPAGPADAHAIAALHTHSWQLAYRGILRDDFLDGPLLENRRALWRERLTCAAQAGRLVLIDEHTVGISAFACAFVNADPQWGTLLDNLHVSPKVKGQGLGRQLMREVAAWTLKEACPRLHLWAYEQNLAARRFYERLGGVVTLRHTEPAPDGAQVNAVRYCWSDLSGLIDKRI